MGLGGISHAAARTSNWAATLSDAGADRAARYAVVELNGLPDYIVPLIGAKPGQVARILNAEIDRQLSASNPEGHGMLDRIAYADPRISALVTPYLLNHLMGEEPISPAMLHKVVDVVVKAIPIDNRGLFAPLRDRAMSAAEPEIAAQYFTLLFAIDGDEATTCLRARMDSYERADRTTLCAYLLPRLFGDRFHRGEQVPTVISFSNLEALVLMAFEGIRQEDDIDRRSGEAYSPGWRDRAQDARQMLFSRLTDTPGEATHGALLRLAGRDDFPVETEWLLELARQRAEGDAVLQPWQAEDVIQFESEFDKPPSTAADLQLLAVRRIEQIDHDLKNDKFTQGTTLQDLPDENAVQRWLGDRFQAMQKQVYTVDRETHVADEKEPDITLHSRSSGISLPIEIKIIDGMTIPQIDRALESQLCGQYLRHQSARHGILLLVHQRPRSRGWELEGHAKLVPLATLLEYIRARAELIRTRSPDGPQPVIACIDVSKVQSLKRNSRGAPGGRG